MLLYEDAKTKEILRVISYHEAPPVLEKRHFYLDSGEGVWKHGKVRGFNAMDFARACQVYEEFWPILSKEFKSAAAPQAIPPQNKEQQEMMDR